MENDEQKPKPEEERGIGRSKHNTADFTEKLRTLLSSRYIICLIFCVSLMLKIEIL